MTDLFRGARWRVVAGVGMAAAALLLAGRARVQATDEPAPKSRPSLAKALADLKVPPPWLDGVKVDWDLSRPWKDGRLEVRRLLGFSTQEANRQAIRLTWDYRDKKDIGNGHEYPMYLFLGAETAWAVRAYEEFLQANPERNTHAYLDLASCYVHYGEYARAEQTLQRALKNLPADAWRIAQHANVLDALGDLSAARGDLAAARKHYTEAAEMLPRSAQPYGRHLLARQAAKIKAKLDVLAMAAIAPGKLVDGTYKGSSLGYAGPLTVTVAVRGGRIASVDVAHTDKIHQNATTIIPQRIVQAQSLKVDSITGATITCQAIVDAGLEALKKAARK